MSEVKVNKISPRTNCGTVQLGDSGDTITIPAGATITNNGTQTGFGRTGTVDWQTGSIKTATFTAESGKGYFCNTTSGGFEVDLPAGSAGAIVSVQDYNNTFDTGNLTIDPNGSEKINGGEAGVALTLDTEGEGLTLVYVDGTVGWRTIHNSNFADVPTTSALICASVSGSGNTLTTIDTNFKLATFTGPGTFTVNSGGGALGVVDYIVVAGGAGGGGGGPAGYGRGGGGAGGYREAKVTATSGCWSASPLAATSSLPLSPGAYPITIGGGGTGGANNSSYNVGTNGSNSIFSTITSAGGGGGGAKEVSGVALAGGSGGGGANSNECQPRNAAGGAGNTPPVSPPQGNNGGAGGNNTGPNCKGGGGGGGATAVGGISGPGTAPNGGPNAGGGGGAGATASITGSPVARAGGGGGGGNAIPGSGAAGGTGGGGNGGGYYAPGPVSSTTGGTNTGGGGGAGGYYPGGASGGSNGGSGIIYIRYKFQ